MRTTEKNVITNKKLIKEFKNFFASAVINKVKFCEECNCTTVNLNNVILHNKSLTIPFFEKVEPIMVKYGFIRYEYVYFKINKDDKK